MLLGGKVDKDKSFKTNIFILLGRDTITLVTHKHDVFLYFKH